MFSRKNEEYLSAQNIASGLCPRDPAELARRLQDPEVQAGMKRRGGTEARVAIFKNVFLGNPAAGRSYAARERACGCAVLTRNLWVLARLPQAISSKDPQQAKSAKPPPRVARTAAWAPATDQPQEKTNRTSSGAMPASSQRLRKRTPGPPKYHQEILRQSTKHHQDARKFQKSHEKRSDKKNPSLGQALSQNYHPSPGFPSASFPPSRLLQKL